MIFRAEIGASQSRIGLLGVIQVDYPQLPETCGGSLGQRFFRVFLKKMVQRIDFFLFDKSDLRGLDNIINCDHLEHVARVIERFVAAFPLVVGQNLEFVLQGVRESVYAFGPGQIFPRE